MTTLHVRVLVLLHPGSIEQYSIENHCVTFLGHVHMPCTIYVETERPVRSVWLVTASLGKVDGQRRMIRAPTLMQGTTVLPRSQRGTSLYRAEWARNRRRLCVMSVP